MPVLVAIFALGLMAYAPGRSLSRLLLPAAGPPAGGRLLVEMLVGNAAVGLVGFAFAEAGLFSLGAVATVLAGVTLAAVFAARAATPAPYAAADASGLGIALLALAWLLPPFETFLYGYDSSVYLGGGMQLARHGGLAFADSSLAALSPAQRASFFPSYFEEGGPPFTRLTGGLLLTSLDDGVVLPAFHHLLQVWVALSWAIGGDGALAAPAAYFGALALWVVSAFAARLGGAVAGVAAALLLTASVPQYWYSRFLMPEVPSQYFLWGGLVVAAASLERRDQGRLGIAAGLGLGLAGMMRLDGLAHLLAALALWRGFAPARSWPAGRGFLPAFGGVALWTALHQVAFPTHYYGEAAKMVRRALTHVRLLLGSTPVALAGMAEPAGGASSAHRVGRVVALLIFSVYFISSFVATTPDVATTLAWLVAYCGWPLLVAALIGLFLWGRGAVVATDRFALALGVLVLVQLANDPRVTPAPLWAIRRFLPVVIPLLVVATSLVLAALWHRRRWLALAALAAMLAGTGTRNVLDYRGAAFQQAMSHVRTLAAEIPRNAVVAVDPGVGVASQIHIALWSATDVPTYLLGAGMQEPLLALRDGIAPRPLYWLGRGDVAATNEIMRIAEPVASYRFDVGVRRLAWYDLRDDAAIREETLWLYRIRPGSDPRRHPAGALH